MQTLQESFSSNLMQRPGAVFDDRRVRRRVKGAAQDEDVRADSVERPDVAVIRPEVSETEVARLVGVRLADPQRDLILGEEHKST